MGHRQYCAWIQAVFEWPRLAGSHEEKVAWLWGLSGGELEKGKLSSQRIQGEMSLRNIGQGVSSDPSAPETCMSYGFLMPVEEDFRQQYEGQMQYDA